jgi:hypothetical protein
MVEAVVLLPYKRMKVLLGSTSSVVATIEMIGVMPLPDAAAT